MVHQAARRPAVTGGLPLPDWTGRAIRAAVAVAAVVVVLAIALLSSSPFQVAYTYAALAGIGAVALTALQGWAGQGSLFVAGLFLVGGYSTAVVPQSLGMTGVPLGIVLAGVVGAVFGYICSLPARRLTGVYLLLGTLALQYIVDDGGNLFQSRSGTLGGYSVGTVLLGQQTWLLLTLALLALTVLYFRRLGKSRVGRAAVLIRNDLGLAQVSGINVTKYLRWLFVVSSTVMAVAGAIETYYTTTVSYDAYGVDLSVQYLVMIVIFGLGSLWGAAAGAVFVVVLGQLLTQVLVGTNGVSNSAAYVVNLIYGLVGFTALLLVSKARNPLPVMGSSRPALWRLSQSLRGRAAPSEGADGGTGPSQMLRRTARSASVAVRSRGSALHSALVGAKWEPDPLRAGLVQDRVVQDRVVQDRVVQDREAQADGGGAQGGGAQGAPDQGHGGTGVRLRRVTVEYGGAQAVSGVDLDIQAGTTVSLVGRNGAGKTSLLLSITGFPKDSGARLRPDSAVYLTRAGEVANITGLAPDRRSRLGVSFVPADGKVFASLTPDEHIRLAAHHSRRSEDEIRQLLDVFADLRSGLDRPAGLLSGGQKQQLALLCALAGQPRVLVVDELTLGLSPSATERVVDALKSVRDVDSEPPTLILAEQSVAVAFDLADTVCLIENGRLLEAGPPTPEFEARVRRSYVGMVEEAA